MSIKPAVNTVTFRQYSPEDTVARMKEEGISVVEWAGDVHVPAGDLSKARQVARLCRDEQVRIASFASYYQCDEEGPGNGPFACNLGPEVVLEAASMLDAPAVRVWAGRRGSGQASASYRSTVARCLGKFCDEAARSGISVHLEYHRNTLTDSPESTVALLKETDRPNLFTYWQPRLGSDEATCLRDLELVAPWLSHVHVFHWSHDGGDGPPERLPLEQGQRHWEKYLALVAGLHGEHFAMMEFVRGDSLEQFKEDARVLQAMISALVA
jgi:sugar phosphate isomerase/epimerase